MSITPPAPIPGQVGFNGQQPFSNQQNFGQILGEVNSYATHVGVPIVANLVNNALRTFLDRRNWYGMLLRGIIQTSGYYSVGQISTVLGSNTIQGTNTGWTQSLSGMPIVGQQLRVGFGAPIYTITGLNQAAQILTLDLPWSQPSLVTSYFIAQYYYSFPNVRYIISCKNPMMMYRLVTNISQSFIETYDPARLQMLYPRMLATMPPDPSGNYLCELWPVPSMVQGLPYLAYAIPSNLVNDGDNLPPFVRADIIKAKAISDVLLYRPKANPNYSESMCLAISQEKRKEFEMEVERASQVDEGLWRADVISQWEMFPTIDPCTGVIPGGAFLAAMTAVSAYGDDY